MSSLGIIPMFLRTEKDLETTVTTLETLVDMEPWLEVLVIDDGSPAQELVDEVDAWTARRALFRLDRRPSNEGFSHTVNVGLRCALEQEQDAILINADIEFVVPFVETFEQTLDSQGRPAAVVGALLLYSSGLIQHGGVFLSFHGRFFDHKFRYGPGTLPEAQQMAVCPVTGALQYVRYSTLQTVGIYDDEHFRMGFEDVDYCLRVFEAGLECVYQPAVKAVHHESMFRGQKNERLDDWQRASLEALHEKHATTPLGRYVLPIA